MAEEKSSFILYANFSEIVNCLDDERAGILFKTIFDYVNDLDPEPTDLMVKMAFIQIKSHLKRDLKQWEQKKVKRSESGTLGGIKSGETRRKKAEEAKQNEAKRSTASINEAKRSDGLKIEANEPVNVNVNVNANVNVNDIKENTPTPFVEVVPTSPGFINFDFSELHLEDEAGQNNFTLFPDEVEFLETEEIGATEDPKVKSVKTKKEKSYETALSVATLSFENEVCAFKTAKFKNAWIELLQMPKWRKKPQTAVNLSLRKIMGYEEDFALLCVEKAIANDYQGIVYDSTQDDYSKYLNKKNGVSNSGTYGSQPQTKGVAMLQTVKEAKERARLRREANND